MIVRAALTWIVFVGILSRVQADGERWSRQVSNSEWIPLPNPRPVQKNQSPAQPAAPPAAAAVVAPADSSAQSAGQVPAVALPPALQQQYQDQLLQLQKTQESIQRLLLLQQQLKAQQQILQSQAYQPDLFVSPEDEKQALHQSTIVNLQTLPELAPEVLVPPVPSSEALPPVFQAQNFRPAGVELKHSHRTNLQSTSHQEYQQTQEDPSPRIKPHHRENADKDYRPRFKSHYESQKLKEEPSHVNFVTPATSTAQDSSEEQEIQLVYVPAETLAQRGQSKLQRQQQNRKHFPNRHHQHLAEITSTPLTPHDAYAREILHQLQRQHEEKNKFLQVERQKEVARLHAEQKELERQARLQEAVRKEQELMRQREAEKKRKELENIEEASRQRELQRIQELREKERQEERRLSQLKAKEEEAQRQELERYSTYEREKDFKRNKDYNQNKDTRTEALAPQNYEVEQQPSAQALAREQQLHHQHLTEVTSKTNKVPRHKSKPRNKLYPYQQHQEEYHETTETHTTLPPPNQPPLSVYMGDSLSDHHRIRLVDVLKTLKSARTIAVLDSFGPETPRVFVGPRNLDPPPGYAKFDLPYLSAIENNRVERKVDKLPFFVAPLSFEPPPGYSKIPFPAPHIGSVVINTLENVEIKPLENQQPNPAPLIEPNSYVSHSQPVYDVSTQVSYSEPVSNTPRYEVSSLPPSQSTKWRYTNYYEPKPSTEVPPAVTAASFNEERTSSNKLERPGKTRNYYTQNEVSTTPNYYSPKTVTAFSFEQTVPQTTPVYHEEPPSHHNVQSHLVEPAIDHHRQIVNHYHEQPQRYPVDPTGHPVTNAYLLNSSPTYEEHTEFSLPAELPAISPQLPGLVNALVEKTDLPSSIHPAATVPTVTTTTTTTTTETPTTTYRARTRQRGRVTSARATTTTLSPPARGNSERTRRPVSRTRSKYTTTTEEYRDSSYDPTRRSSITTLRYEDQDSNTRRPLIRNQNYKPREEETRESIQTPIVDPNSPSSEQDQRDAFEGAQPSVDTATPTSELSGPFYQQDDYSASTSPPVFSSHREASVADSILPLAGLEYTRKQHQQPSYQIASSPAYNVDETPVNGFNYRTLEASPVSQTTRDFSYYRPGKTESVLFEPIPATDSPNVQRSHLQDFSPIYHSVVQGQFEKNETPRPVYRESSGNIQHSGEDQPIYLTIPQDKQEEYSYQTTVTDLPETTTPTTTTTTTTSTTTTTTTEAPVIIRQRVRARLSGRPAQTESTIQTRPRGSQDEYVRFSAVNQESQSKPQQRQRARPRTRAQTNSPIQTDGQEYVRIQSAPSQQRRPSTSAPQTTRSSEERSSEEDDYGFIRSPNYKAAPAKDNHKTTQSQSVETPESSSSTESSQSHVQLLKSRQKLYAATRRPSSRATTTPRSNEEAHTIRSRTRSSNAQSEESNKSNKSRNRVRRPGGAKRRTTTTTTTTESADANNELDENYPRQQEQAELYDDKVYETVPSRSVPRRGQEIADENYPQEFLFNYGASQQGYRQDDFDQSGDSTRRQQQSTSSKGSPKQRPTGDIYGAESQWSTKLTGNSFQPSSYTPNQAGDAAVKPQDLFGQEKAGDLPEIITAGPDVPSITVLVTSDDENAEQKQPHETAGPSSEESIMGSMMESMIDFGKKMNDEAESDSPTTTTTAAPSSSEATPVVENVSKSGATFKKAGLRRRRVRVRVRPTGSEDFVTAESQSYDSSLNNLPHEGNKFRNFYVTTEPKPTTAVTTTTTTTTAELDKTEKSVFETFLDTMLAEHEEPAATTVLPEITTTNPNVAWMMESTIAPAMETTVKEMIITTLKTKDDEADSTESPDTTTTFVEPSSTSTTTTQKSEEVKSNSGENSIQSLTPDNSFRYFATKSPAFSEYLRHQEKSKMSEDDINHPKNHRSKWSEVRYPSDKSVFDYAKWKPKNQTGEATKNEEKQAKNDDTVTDYVKAIFESIKSADEEHHQDFKLADEKSKSRKEKELETSSEYPTEVKTSVSSSSRVVARPAQHIFVQQQQNPTTTTTTTTTGTPVATFGPFVPSMMSDKQTGPIKKSSFETNLGKILRTSTSTKVSHMTEICYRGRCVMSKPKKEGISR